MVNHHPHRPHLKSWRKHFGKTLEWLAHELGVSHSTVLRHEQEGNGCDHKTFERIALIYGITIAELSVHPVEREKARELERLLAAAQDLDQETIAVVVKFIERMKSAK